MKGVFFILAALVSVVPTSAQSIQPCSDFSIEAVEKVDPGTSIVLSARTNTRDVSLRGLRFNWSASVGTIIAGQGTSNITVDTTALGGQLITATVEVVGSQMHCSTSKTVSVNPPPLPIDPFDSYGDIQFSSEKARLDNFAIQIQNYPGARGAIFTYAGQQTYRGEALDRLQRAKNYLVNFRGLSPERILTVDAGYDTTVSTYLFVVPAGATIPTFESKVPIDQVQFTKRRPASKKSKN